MSRPDGRIPLSPQPGDEHEWTFLLPVVKAERSWGNRTFTPEFQPAGRGEGWYLMFREPLHINRLRDRFLFPDFVRLIDDEPRTAVIDGRYPYQETSIQGGIALGWVSGDSPSGYVRDTSRITRLLLRSQARRGMRPLVRRRRPLTYSGGLRRAHAGRGGAPATGFGWPPGPLAPLYVWQTASRVPHLFILGSASFVEATTERDASRAGLPLDTPVAVATSLDDFLSLVPEGCGVQVDGDTREARAVPAAVLGDLRLRDAPSLEQEGVELAPVSEQLAGELARLSDRLTDHAVQAAYVVVARSTPDEHGEVTEGLWVAVFKKTTPLHRLDDVWAAVVEADLWPPVRLVVGDDLGFIRANAFLTAGTRVGMTAARRPVLVRPLSWRESWLVTLGVVLGALPYALSSAANDPLPAESRYTWTSVVAEVVLLFFVLRWALGRRLDGQPVSRGRPIVVFGKWLGAALFGFAALVGLLMVRS
jgi:hypothetical protein